LSALGHKCDVMQHTWQQHDAVTEAIVDQDAERVREAMTAHLRYSCDRVVEAYDRGDMDLRVISED